MAMSLKKFVLLLTLAVILCTSAVRTGLGEQGSMKSAAVHSLDPPIVLTSIQVGNNDTYTIENGHYVVNGSITVKQNATLIISNAIVDFNTTSSDVLSAYDNATVNISNATISAATGYFYIYSHGKTTLNLINSSLLGYSYMSIQDTSQGLVTDSNTYSFYVYNNGTITMRDTKTQYFYCYSFSSASLTNCMINVLDAYDSSHVSLADSIVSYTIYLRFQSNSSLSISLPQGIVKYWNLYQNNTVTKAYSNLTITNSRIGSWGVYIMDTSAVVISDSSLNTLETYANATAVVDNCTINSVYVDDQSSISLTDSTVTSSVSLDFSDSQLALSVRNGHFAHWNLYEDNSVATAYVNFTLQNSNVTSWDINFYDNSTISVFNSTVGSLEGNAFSSALVSSSSVNALYTYESSTANATASDFNSISAYDNSTVFASQIMAEYLSISDYASTEIQDSSITQQISLSFVADSNVSLDSLPMGGIAYWNLYDNASITKAYLNLTLINTKNRGWGDIEAYDESTVSISNSVLNYVDAYDSSQFTLLNSLAYSVYVDYNSTVTLASSTVDSVTLDLKMDSNISFKSLPTGMIDYWSLYQNSTVGKAYVNLTILNSWLGEWDFYAYDSTALTFAHCKLGYVGAYSSSKISMDNCTLSSSLSLYDRSTMTVTDSILQSTIYVSLELNTEISGLLLPIGHVDSWNLYDGSSVQQAYLNLTISNTTVNAWGVYTYGFSMISFVNSTIGYLNTNDFSTVSMQDCTVKDLYLYTLSQLTVTSAPSGTSVIEYLYTYGMSSASLTESKVAITSAYQYSTVNLTGTDYAVIQVNDLATVQTNWYSDIHMVDQTSQNVAFANVTVSDSKGVTVYSSQTDAEGWANFTLREKVINAFGSHPAGNYTITGTYTPYSASASLAVTKNQKITIKLPFIVPEFNPTLTTPLILMFLAVAAIALTKSRRPLKPQTSKNPHTSDMSFHLKG
jgi:hypothetical protein